MRNKIAKQLRKLAINLVGNRPTYYQTDSRGCIKLGKCTRDTYLKAKQKYKEVKKNAMYKVQ